jgi:hypothetical protein
VKHDRQLITTARNLGRDLEIAEKQLDVEEKKKKPVVVRSHQFFPHRSHVLHMPRFDAF